MNINNGLFLWWCAQRRRLLAGKPAWQNYLSSVFVFSLFATGCILLTGCESPDDSEDAYDAAMRASAEFHQAGKPDYSTNCLQEGDVVSIMFRYSTNFNTLQKIGIDGNLNLDVAGQIKAVGKTVLQLQDELTTLYQSEAKGDPITVKVVTPEAVVYVVGEVTRPGKIPMERPMTALEAIMEAGGYDPYQANLAGVSVLRIENGEQRTYAVNVKHVIDGKDDRVFYLKPFDIVRVPAKTFNY